MEFNTLNITTVFRSIFISLLLVCVSCAAQEKKDTVTVSKGVVPVQSWSAILSVSGGFAGWDKNISIDSGGLVIINNLKTGMSSRKKLNNKELLALSALVHQQKNTSVVAGSRNFSKRCADCFEYKLSIRWQNRQQLAVLNDINLSKSPYQSIVRFLRKTMSKY